VFAGYRRAGEDMKLKTPEDQAAARTEIFGRIRFYVNPYAGKENGRE
jgi:hypothetical protein